ncbi:LacI family DNA-binding transcriptional regulator, partial [Devosia sp.]|uniref:LacI family DNA-binding transcriptional regulator n=1 Tax=Devosia sp. TaxID=1871048 RepID=UPI001AC8002C
MAKKRSASRPTVADVAALAGVGAITVSRALRDPSKVSPALRESIDKAVRQLNYVPNLNARALASRRSDAVAVLVPSLTQNIFSDVVRGIYDGLTDSKLRIELGNTRYDAQIEEELVTRIIRHQPAAIIVSGTEQTAATRRMLEEAGCPVVQIMDMTDNPIQKIIGFSHRNAGLAMTRHMLAAGYQRIAFFAGWMNARSKQRFEGYRQAMQEAGRYDEGLLRETGNDESELSRTGHDRQHEFSSTMIGKRLMLDMLDTRPDVDAIFCNNDVLALGALFACQERGVSVPDRMGIAGFNDFDYMSAACPALSSIRIHRWRCGFEAMQSVCQQLAGGPIGEPIVDLGFEIINHTNT